MRFSVKMLDDSEITKLMTEMDSVRSEIRALRGKINSLDRKKEELFREKRKISSDVYARIKDAQSFKDKRNSLTDVVKNTKMSKEEQEQRIKVLEQEIAVLKEDKRKVLDKLGVEDPSRLKKSIKQLEFKIETEALSFEKEKELMKVLSKMKKQYEQSKSVVDIEHKLDVRFRELHELRDQIDMSRKIVQVSAKESQKHHLELIESSKEIDELKKKEADLETSISPIKEEMHTISEELNAKSARIDEIKKILSENNIKFKEDADKSASEILKAKDEEVQEKIRTGKKLTTEDLLVLQRMMKKE